MVFSTIKIRIFAPEHVNVFCSLSPLYFLISSLSFFKADNSTATSLFKTTYLFNLFLFYEHLHWKP